MYTMCKSLFVILLIMTFYAVAAVSETNPTQEPTTGIPAYSNESSAQFMREWLLCGPFSNPKGPDGGSSDRHLSRFDYDFLQEYGGETELNVKEGATVEIDSEKASWKRYVSPTDEINLDTAVGTGDCLLTYAYCEFMAETQQVALLSVGTNDGCRIFVNGEAVLDHVRGRPAVADEDIIPVHLKKGRNRLLLKIENRGRSWGFLCRLVLLGGSQPVPEQFRLFDVEIQQSAPPQLRLLYPQLLSMNAIADTNIEIFKDSYDKSPIWHGELPQDGVLEIPVDSQNFAKYLLRTHVKFNDGGEYKQTIPFTSGEKHTYTLFDNGTTNYEIVIADDPSESEWWAAQELQHWLMEISGAYFRIRSESERRRASHLISIGDSQTTRALLDKDFKPMAEDDESFLYRNTGADIVIYGGRLRGTMYGVMTFLEREFHCRWLTPNVESIPSYDTYSFSYLNHAESPGIRVRDMEIFDCDDPVWCARNKVNSDSMSGTGTVPDKDGNIRTPIKRRHQVGGIDSYWSVHTFGKLMPEWEFLDEHPEYFSLLNGERKYIPNDSQPCLSNPDVLRIMTERILAVMREQPEHLMYSVSQNDGDNPCQCENCQALIKKYGGESGLILWFVNQVADEVKKEFPNKFISTLAYHYTQSPPVGIIPRDNVVIRLCNFHGCFSHPLSDDCSKNAPFVQDIEKWSQIAPHLFIWDYVTNFEHYPSPFPNLRILQQHIRFYRDHKAFGYYPQGISHTTGSEFGPLRSYLLAKLLWNPDCDAEAVIDDFVQGYYRNSSIYVRRYIDLLHNRITPNTHMGEYLKLDNALFSDEFIYRAEELFDEAEKAADDMDVLRRVEMARLPVMYLKCYRMPTLAKRDRTFERVKKIIEQTPITHLSDKPEHEYEGFIKMIEEAK